MAPMLAPAWSEASTLRVPINPISALPDNTVRIALASPVTKICELKTRNRGGPFRAHGSRIVPENMGNTFEAIADLPTPPTSAGLRV
jgi:hypothetical protein